MSTIQITTKTINATPRKLKASWTIDPVQDLMSATLAKEIQEEMDREIFWELFKTAFPDWTQIKLPYPIARTLNEHVIKTWCSENLKGNFNGYREQWMFEIPEDATWFIIRWFNEEKQQ
jgi:hypothetical protein